MTDKVIVLGGGIRGGGTSRVNLMLEEFINSMTTSYDANYIIRGELPPEPAVYNEYFTPKKREIPSSLFEALLKRIENE